jgi:hypothetical protein
MYLAALLLMLAVEAVLQPEQQIHFEVEADTRVLLGETLVLFLEELALLGELTSDEHGSPDGTYPGSDAAQGYDQG